MKSPAGIWGALSRRSLSRLLGIQNSIKTDLLAGAGIIDQECWPGRSEERRVGKELGETDLEKMLRVCGPAQTDALWSSGSLSLSQRRKLCPHYNNLSLLVPGHFWSWRNPMKNVRSAGCRCKGQDTPRAVPWKCEYSPNAHQPQFLQGSCWLQTANRNCRKHILS